ncbi:MAG: hypothetical protein S4CHLAM102_03330 [Chlamydiia bacterium]|nr:hypothetical protein [Chlamydiia bacterium]
MNPATPRFIPPLNVEFSTPEGMDVKSDTSSSARSARWTPPRLPGYAVRSLDMDVDLAELEERRQTELLNPCARVFRCKSNHVDMLGHRLRSAIEHPKSPDVRVIFVDTSTPAQEAVPVKQVEEMHPSDKRLLLPPLGKQNHGTSGRWTSVPDSNHVAADYSLLDTVVRAVNSPEKTLYEHCAEELRLRSGEHAAVRTALFATQLLVYERVSCHVFLPTCVQDQVGFGINFPIAENREGSGASRLGYDSFQSAREANYGMPLEHSDRAGRTFGELRQNGMIEVLTPVFLEKGRRPFNLLELQGAHSAVLPSLNDNHPLYSQADDIALLILREGGLTLEIINYLQELGVTEEVIEGNLCTRLDAVFHPDEETLDNYICSLEADDEQRAEIGQYETRFRQALETRAVHVDPVCGPIMGLLMRRKRSPLETQLFEFYTDHAEVVTVNGKSRLVNFNFSIPPELLRGFLLQFLEQLSIEKGANAKIPQAIKPILLLLGVKNRDCKAVLERLAILLEKKAQENQLEKQYAQDASIAPTTFGSGGYALSSSKTLEELADSMDLEPSFEAPKPPSEREANARRVEQIREIIRSTPCDFGVIRQGSFLHECLCQTRALPRVINVEVDKLFDTYGREIALDLLNKTAQKEMTRREALTTYTEQMDKILEEYQEKIESIPLRSKQALIHANLIRIAQSVNVANEFTRAFVLETLLDADNKLYYRGTAIHETYNAIRRAVFPFKIANQRDSVSHITPGILAGIDTIPSTQEMQYWVMNIAEWSGTPLPLPQLSAMSDGEIRDRFFAIGRELNRRAKSEVLANVLLNCPVEKWKEFCMIIHRGFNQVCNKPFLEFQFFPKAVGAIQPEGYLECDELFRRQELVELVRVTRANTKWDELRERVHFPDASEGERLQKLLGHTLSIRPCPLCDAAKPLTTRIVPEERREQFGPLDQAQLNSVLSHKKWEIKK